MSYRFVYIQLVCMLLATDLGCTPRFPDRDSIASNNSAAIETTTKADSFAAPCVELVDPEKGNIRTGIRPFRLEVDNKSGDILSMDAGEGLSILEMFVENTRVPRVGEASVSLTEAPIHGRYPEITIEPHSKTDLWFNIESMYLVEKPGVYTLHIRKAVWSRKQLLMLPISIRFSIP